MNAPCVRVQVCMRAWHFSHCSHPFALARLGVLPTILHLRYHPRTKTRHRHDIDTTSTLTSTCSLSPPLPLPSPPSSATTPGQQCARSYDHATTTIMRPTMTPTTTRNDTMHSIARVVPSLVSWSCLKGLTSRRPVESAQTQTVLSSDPVAIFIASGETSTARTQLR
jgi:hypothetical protein